VCVFICVCVCVFMCVGEWGIMMKCLLVLQCDGFPEDISSPTERTLCLWLFCLCSGKGRANPCICTFHMTGKRWQRNSYWWQFPSHKHSIHVTWSDYNNTRQNLTLTACRFIVKNVYFLVNITFLYKREYETHPNVIMSLLKCVCVCVCMCVCVCVCVTNVSSVHIVGTSWRSWIRAS
jgi:hypothetical protein